MISYLYPPTPVSVTVPPLEFVLNGAPSQVIQDTANAANNKPLPTGLFFIKDGVPVPVLVDTVTPANSRLLPVELSSLAGPINVTAGDLNVAISSVNDSVAIGDGVTGLLANVTTNATTTLEELHVTDDDAIALLTTIDGDTSALAANLGTVGAAPIATGVQALGTDGTLATRLKTNAGGQLEVVTASSALPTGAATLAEQQAQTALLGTIDGDTSALAGTVSTDGNPAPLTGVVIGGKDSAGNFQQASINTAGELLVNFSGLAGFATEATLSTINGKLTNNFGIVGDAVRAAAQIGNATGAANFNSGADTAQTLRVSANLKRSGSELSYDTGAADANTLRQVLATRHEAAGTPLSMRLSDGATFIGEASLVGNAQKVVSTNGQTLKVAAFALGFDSVNNIHKELLLDGSGRLVTVSRPAALAYEDARSAVIANTDVTTIAIPSGTVKFKVQAIDTNTVNLRMRIDADPTATAGMQLQAGRSEDYECTGTQLRFIAESAATGQAVEVHFFKA